MRRFLAVVRTDQGRASDMSLDQLTRHPYVTVDEALRSVDVVEDRSSLFGLLYNTEAGMPLDHRLNVSDLMSRQHEHSPIVLADAVILREQQLDVSPAV